MHVDCFILDFDGTFTDVEQEAGPFLEAYREDLASTFGQELADAWEQASARVADAPREHGWEHGGRIVAPATSDPYLRATVTASALLDERGMLEDADERMQVLGEMYKRNYGKSGACFRPEAKAVIEALLRTGKPAYVVSNSDTRAVRGQIDRLAPSDRERLSVLGDARKFVIAEPERRDARFETLPEQTWVDGLERPIYLRRGHYYEVLRDIWEQTGTSPQRTFVVGDIYELDLAMPARLGAQVHLLARDSTPEHEQRAARSDAGADAVSEDLWSVLTRLGLSVQGS